MCGIIGFTGTTNAIDKLVDGLKKLEYRGYDSAGISTISLDNSLQTVKAVGKINCLQEAISSSNMNPCHIGIGHTRWATHGVPSIVNAHPHVNTSKTISIVHNGIIENFENLKEELQEHGYPFTSQSDSEVIVALLDYYYNGNMLQTMQKAMNRMIGSYALCVLDIHKKDTIYITKKDSPIAIASCNQGHFVTSDSSAILEYSNKFNFLEDNQYAVITPTTKTFYDHELNEINIEEITLSLDHETIQKDGFETFMLKEIYEQPLALKETLQGKIKDHKVIFNELKEVDFTKYTRIYYVACGTAYHACISGSKVVEELTHLPVFCQVASEFRYNNPIIDEYTLVIVASQSGQTADTLAALTLANQRGATTIAIVNVLGSTIAREANYTLYTRAKIEISVASTKAYTTQVLLLVLLGLYIYQERIPSVLLDKQFLTQIEELPEIITTMLQNTTQLNHIAALIAQKNDITYIARGYDYASVLEGSLKLKEITYIHSTAYYAGELKHGPIALIEPGTIVICLSTNPSIALKTQSNIQETIARGAIVIQILATNKNKTDNETTIYIPQVNHYIQPILSVIPLQFLAYFTAKHKGMDIDQPRNLAKSVTVE